jgi:flagellar biosynthesis chaperone FliJ
MQLKVLHLLQYQHQKILQKWEQEYRQWKNKRVAEEAQRMVLRTYHAEYRQQLEGSLQEGLKQGVLLHYIRFLEQLQTMMEQQDVKITEYLHREHNAKNYWKKAYLKEQTLKKQVSEHRIKNEREREKKADQEDTAAFFQRKYATLRQSDLESGRME